MKKSAIKALRIIIYGGLAALAVTVGVVFVLLPENEQQAIANWEEFYGLEGGSLSGQYLAARHAATQRDFDAAENHLEKALELAPNDERLLAQTMQLALMNGDIEGAVPLALRLEALGTKDGIGLLARAIHHAKQGTYSAALEVLEEDSPGGLYILMRPLMRHWVAIATNPPTQPISLAADAKRAGQLAPFIIYQEALMNDVLGFDAAVDASYGKMAEHPQFLPFRLVEALMNHKIRTGKQEEAAQLLQAYLAANPDSGFADEDNLLREEPEALVGSVHDGMAELFFTSASILMGQDAFADAAAYLQMALYLDDDNAPALFMLASIYEQYNEHEKAIALYEAIGKEAPYYRRGEVRKALNISAMGDVKGAIEALKKQAKARPEDADPLVSLGDTYRTEQDFTKAAEMYTQAIERSAHPNWGLYYARGIAYERSKEWEKAEADFISALSLEPDQPDVLNYLGYSLIDRGERMEEAAEMISKALEQRPYAGHIVDSMGWALYQLGRYEEAVEYLEQATDLTPHDPTVNDHLGDAYWRVGRKVEAKYQWERALIFDPEEELKAKLEAKIQAGLNKAEETSHVEQALPKDAQARVTE